MNPAIGSSTGVDHGRRDPDESDRKMTEAEQLRRQAKRALQLADSVLYQHRLCSLAGAAELLAKAQHLETARTAPAGKQRRKAWLTLFCASSFRLA
jgi:hypothetical protein